MKKGFTLIEFIIVLMIIAIIAAVVMGKINSGGETTSEMIGSPSQAQMEPSGPTVTSFTISKDLTKDSADMDVKRALSAKEVDPGSVIGIFPFEVDGIKKAKIFYLK